MPRSQSRDVSPQVPSRDSLLRKPWTSLDHLAPEARSWVQTLLDYEREGLSKAERTWRIGECLAQIIAHQTYRLLSCESPEEFFDCFQPFKARQGHNYIQVYNQLRREQLKDRDHGIASLLVITRAEGPYVQPLLDLGSGQSVKNITAARGLAERARTVADGKAWIAWKLGNGPRPEEETLEPPPELTMEEQGNQVSRELDRLQPDLSRMEESLQKGGSLPEVQATGLRLKLEQTMGLIRAVTVAMDHPDGPKGPPPAASPAGPAKSAGSGPMAGPPGPAAAGAQEPAQGQSEDTKESTHPAEASTAPAAASTGPAAAAQPAPARAAAPAPAPAAAQAAVAVTPAPAVVTPAPTVGTPAPATRAAAAVTPSLQLPPEVLVFRLLFRFFLEELPPGPQHFIQNTLGSLIRGDHPRYRVLELYRELRPFLPQTHPLKKHLSELGRVLRGEGIAGRRFALYCLLAARLPGCEQKLRELGQADLPAGLLSLVRFYRDLLLGPSYA